jgi:L-rhamnose mutarotase
MARHCIVGRVRPDRLAEYRQRHAAVWPELLRALRDAGWRNYSLFLSEDGLLVGHFEADDLDAAQRAVAATEVNSRWQHEMSEFFVGVDGGHPDQNWRFLDQVFNLEDQLRAAGEKVTTDDGA